MAGGVLTVALAIGDPELAERVRARLSESGGFAITGADDDREPELLITDSLDEIADRRADVVPVMVLAGAAEAAEALHAGATAALSADTHADALAVAARAAAAGLTTASPEVRHHLLDERSVTAIEDGDEPPSPGLTARELQVLALLVEGASNKAIARRLDITPHTAKFHVAAIAAKLGAAGRTDAVAKALRLGLVMA